MVYMMAGLQPSGQSSAILLYITHSFYTTVQIYAVHIYIYTSMYVITKSCTNYEILYTVSARLLLADEIIPKGMIKT